AIDDLGIGATNVGVADSEAVGDTGSIVLDQSVGLNREPAHEVAAVLLLDVDHDAALVAVEVQERRGEAAALWADAPAHRVALGRFDFDHVGAKVAEQLSAERPRNDGRQVKNAKTDQRSISHDENPSSANGRASVILAAIKRGVTERAVQCDFDQLSSRNSSAATIPQFTRPICQITAAKPA